MTPRRRMIRGLLIAASIVLFSGFARRASAQEQEPQPSNALLMQRIDELQSELQELRAERNYAAAMPEASYPDQAPAAPQAAAPAAAPAPPKYPTVKLTGFVQADAAFFSQDPGNMAALGDIQDGADFRRTRLAATGDAWENVGYMVEMDYSAAGRPSFMDVWAEKRDGWLGSNFRMGQYRQPFGMDGLTSVRELPFLERGLPFAFLPFRQIGAMSYGVSEDELSTYAISGFRFPTDAYGGNIGDFGGFGVATRLTRLLIDGENGVLHVGGGYCFIDPSNNILRFRNQPEIAVVETGDLGPILATIPNQVPTFIDTGNITAKNFHLANAELGATLGSFYTQAEVFFAGVDQTAGPDLYFTGAYAQAAYVLTGETRPYNKKGGVFTRFDPFCPFGINGGLGAWELAARYSYIDLNNGNIAGGRLNDLTFGVNWYWNRYTKMQFNYIHMMLGTSPAVAGPIFQNTSADAYAVRLQFDF